MSEAGEERRRILTGVRPTGALHLGHYAGARSRSGSAAGTGRNSDRGTNVRGK